MTKDETRSMNKKAAAIRWHVRWYVLGCIGFLLLGGLFIGLGVMRALGMFRSTAVIFLALGGIVLIVDMVKSLDYEVSVPKDFVPVSAAGFPALFSLVNEVTSTLGIAPVTRLYLCPQAFAAVFIRPGIKNVLSKHPDLELVLGLGFLTQLSDLQLRTVLFHEFGHYCQESIRETGSVYRFGQYAKMVLAERKESTDSILGNQIYAQSAMFYMFTLKFAGRVSMDYRELSELMEYGADDVAERHVGGAVLKETIRKASAVKDAYDAIHWGLSCLPKKSFIDNEYLSLSLVIRDVGSLKDMNSACRRRIDRLPDTVRDTREDSFKIQVEAGSYLESHAAKGDGQSYPAAGFAEWLIQGLPIYIQKAQERKSAVVHIHMDPRKHRIPLVDGLYQLLLDNNDVGFGNYLKGYDIRLRIAPGKHSVKAYLPSGVKSPAFDFEVEEGGTYQIEMDYVCHLNGVYEIFAQDFQKKS